MVKAITSCRNTLTLKLISCCRQVQSCQLLTHTASTAKAVETQASHKSPVQICPRKKIWFMATARKYICLHAHLFALPTGLLRKPCYFCWPSCTMANVWWPEGFQWRPSCRSDGIVSSIQPELDSN